MASPFWVEEVAEDVEEEVFENPIRKKLNEIVIPELSLKEVTLEEAIIFLRQSAAECDSEQEPPRRGLSFVVRSPKVTFEDKGLDGGEGFGESAEPYGEVIDSLEAYDVSLAKALDLVCAKAGFRWKVDEFAITIFPKEGKGVPKTIEQADPEDPFANQSE